MSFPLQALTTELYPGIGQIWNQNTQLFCQSLNENGVNELTQSYIDKALISLRILRKLTIFGVPEPLAFDACMAFMNSIIPCLKKVVELRVQLLTLKTANGDGATTQMLESSEKFILKLMKLQNEFLDTHTKHFVGFIPIALEFSFNYVFYTGTQQIFDAQNQINFPNFAINCINLMKNIAMKASNEEQAPIKTDAKNEFFTVERLRYISEKIITYYFLLTPKDLELWNEDPEQYAFDEVGESWKYELRVSVTRACSMPAGQLI